MAEEFIKTKTWKDNLLCLASSQYFQKKVTETIGKELIKQNQQLHKEIDALEAIYNDLQEENEKLNIKYPLYKVEMKPGLEKNEEFFVISRQQLKAANNQLLKISKALNKALINKQLQQEEQELLFNGINEQKKEEEDFKEIDKFIDQQRVNQRKVSGTSTTLSIQTNAFNNEKLIQKTNSQESNQQSNQVKLNEQEKVVQSNETNKKKTKNKNKRKNRKKKKQNDNIGKNKQDIQSEIQEHQEESIKQDYEKIQNINTSDLRNKEEIKKDTITEIEKDLTQIEGQKNEQEQSNINILELDQTNSQIKLNNPVTLKQQLAKEFIFQSIENIQKNMKSLGLINFNKPNKILNQNIIINRQNAQKFDDSLVKGWELLQKRWDQCLGNELHKFN